MSKGTPPPSKASSTSLYVKFDFVDYETTGEFYLTSLISFIESNL